MQESCLGSNTIKDHKMIIYRRVGKKGIMLKFLTVLLLTLIIFGFGSCVISKFFRLSDQAKSNFDELYKNILEVQKSTVPTSRSFAFIQDMDTYVYFITDSTRGKLQVAEGNRYELNIPKDCQNISCICLCQEHEEVSKEMSSGVSGGSGSVGTSESVRKCKEDKLVCKTLPGIKISPDTEIVAHRTDENLRRQQVRIIKCAGQEAYCKSNKGDISVIFDWWDDKGYYNAVK
ncbi:MAG: hypothetical protein KKA62_05645 [Nanoarchaeota archaeon]|nr:hypothetical protein [Nanoarchaeota archaeon]MBU1644694.1 hypothetical protein [Nanoarchaeota archaeon]MBU1977407.1 hypothetical protein [Nanoarchaeota archaeon]